MTQDEKELEDNDLHIAVRLGDVEATKSALNNGYQPDEIGLFEWSALHEASNNGDFELVEVLLEHGGNPNHPDLVSANTSLHYACSEGHLSCLQALIKHGGNINIKNRRGKTCIDLVEDTECLALLKNLEKGKEETKCKQLTSQKSLHTTTTAMVHEPPVCKTPEKSKPHSRLPQQHTKRIASMDSIDSGVISPTHSVNGSKLLGNERVHLKVPSSPVRSIGSSYGSLTSLGSSGCSFSDDCAGEFVLSFRYNSKKQELKVCIWEIRILSLLPPSQMPKGSSIHLYIKTVILPADQYEPSTNLKRKTGIYNLHAGKTIEQEHQLGTTLSWLDGEAKLEFKNSLALEYKEVPKQLVESSGIKISLCVQPKRSFISNKSKLPSDPVLASTEMPLSQAVKRLMKESYEAERHEVPGITRQSYQLDSVLSHSGVSNPSFNSDPSVQIEMSLLNDEPENSPRCASDSEIKHKSSSRSKPVTSPVLLHVENDDDLENEMAVKYNESSLKSVSTHVGHANKSYKIPIGVPTISAGLSRVEVHSTKRRDKNVGLQMPQLTSDYYNPALMKQTDTRGRSSHHHQRHKHRPKSASKLLASVSSSLILPNTSAVKALDNEEMSVGSPSEEQSDFEPSEGGQLYTHNRSNSSSSFTEVDESPSRRKNPVTYSSPKQNRQLTVPQRRQQHPKQSAWTLQMDPNDVAVDLERRIKTQRDTTEQYELDTFAKHGGDFTHKSRGESRNRQRHRKTDSGRSSTKEQALRRLVYDEFSLSREAHQSNANPGFVND